MGDAFFCERGALELGRLLSWQKKEKGLKSCSFMPFFGPFGGREVGEPLRIVKVFCIYFWIGLNCILRMSLCHC